MGEIDQVVCMIVWSTHVPDYDPQTIALSAWCDRIEMYYSVWCIIRCVCSYYILQFTFGILETNSIIRSKFEKDLDLNNWQSVTRPLDNVMCLGLGVMFVYRCFSR